MYNKSKTVEPAYLDNKSVGFQQLLSIQKTLIYTHTPLFLYGGLPHTPIIQLSIRLPSVSQKKPAGCEAAGYDL